MRPRTDKQTHRQTHRRTWPQYILRRIRLTHNVIRKPSFEETPASFPPVTVNYDLWSSINELTNQSINQFIKSTQQTCIPQKMSKTRIMLLKWTVINKWILTQVTITLGWYKYMSILTHIVTSMICVSIISIPHIYVKSYYFTNFYLPHLYLVEIPLEFCQDLSCEKPRVPSFPCNYYCLMSSSFIVTQI